MGRQIVMQAIRERGGSFVVFALLAGACLFLSTVFVRQNWDAFVRYLPVPEQTLVPKNGNAYVVFYKPKCGCDSDLVDWLDKKKDKTVEVVILTTQMNAEVEHIALTRPKRARVIVTQSSTLERQFCPSKTTTISLVKVGKIVTQISGNDAMTFLKKI